MGGSSGVDSSDRASGVGGLARLPTADDVTGDDRGQPDDDADDQPGAASGRISYRVGNHGGRDDDDAGDGHPRPRVVGATEPRQAHAIRIARGRMPVKKRAGTPS